LVAVGNPEVVEMVAITGHTHVLLKRVPEWRVEGDKQESVDVKEE
jgi:hypothetical protein